MKVIRSFSITRYIAQVLFMLVPTTMVVVFLLWNTTHYLTLIKDQWQTQGVYFALGMVCALTLYQFRLRFLPSFGALLFLFFTINKIVDNYSFTEFDGLIISVNFQLFSILFSIGWLFGWAFQRVKYSSVIISGILLLCGILLISKTGELTPSKLLLYFSPLALYAIGLVYVQTSLHQLERGSRNMWLGYFIRMLVFASALLLLFRLVIYLMYPEIKERVEEYGGGGKEGQSELLKTNKDGTVENKQRLGLSGNNKKNNNPEPLFCAHIDHFMPGTDIPNPLYLTSFHFSRYDATTETFERDSAFKFNDEFVPDPSRIPLFFTYSDSSRIRNSFANKFKETVNIEVYNKRLSPSAFLSPSTGFFVQPITVEKEFQTLFHSAYRAKSYVSTLNSAYFIYNNDHPLLRSFQEERFNELRKATSYKKVDPEFMQYYTEFESNGVFLPVKKLGDSLARGKNTAVDKVLAVRDYFLQKNDLGEQVYSYTDNPGVPGLPGANKLLYFLFESKKGYCAYYAAATVFLLRSMKIPSRVVTGFLTVDRSDKNKGWFWFYEDQSHAWVQVYFPEYGWIDFDTTVGNEDAQHSPTPDGTPPLQPPNAVLAAKGIASETDTLNKRLKIRLSDLIFKDTEYRKLDTNLVLDMHIANVWRDSVQVKLQDVRKGDRIMAVSYAEQLKAFSPEKKAADVLRKLPKNIPTDDLFIRTKNEDEKKNIASKPINDSHGISFYLVRLTMLMALFFLILFSLPLITFYYFRWRMQRSKSLADRAYFIYKTSTFYLHQLGIERKDETSLQYARMTVDKRIGSSFEAFMIRYLKIKYSRSALNPEEEKDLNQFYAVFEEQVKQAIPGDKRVRRFMHLPRYFRYFWLKLNEEEW